MTIPIPPGVFDIIPNDPKEPWRNSHLWKYVEKVINETARDYGFQQIRTPIFERTELFARGVGEATDIVSKEMYTFNDRGDRSMTLRPEGTAPAMRAFIEHQMHQQSPLTRLYYISPMFRYERQQAGRYRQHHQFGVEVIGNASAEIDAEGIDLLYTLYNRLGLKNLNLYINSLGDAQSREAYRNALKEYLKQSFDCLSEDSKKRFETNPLRILDSKDPEDRKIIAAAPSILDFLNEECKTHFEELKRLLTQLQIPFIVNPQLVRGLDYYNKTVFEITSGDLGAQNSVGGGGRYDGLTKTLGGPDLPSFGFGTGIERIIQTLLNQSIPVPEAYRPVLFLIPMGDEAKKACFTLVHNLRQEGVSAEIDFSGKKLNKAMSYANTIKARYVAVIGDNELKSQEIELKEMATGTTTKAPLKNLSRIMHLESLEDDFLKLWTEMSKPFETKAEAEFFLQRVNRAIDQTKQVTTKLQDAVSEMKSFLE